jgi:Flp pilus assembly protein TadD
VLSLLNFGEAVPGSIVGLDDLSSWCPTCFAGGRPAPAVAGLDAYMALMRMAYSASPADVRRARAMAEQEGREIAGSAYLGAIVPETAEVHNALGLSLASAGRMQEAIAEFRRAAEMDPGRADTHWHLGAALASVGALDEAAARLRRAIEIDPGHSAARSDLNSVLAIGEQRRGARRN